MFPGPMPWKNKNVRHVYKVCVIYGFPGHEGKRCTHFKYFNCGQKGHKREECKNLLMMRMHEMQLTGKENEEKTGKE